MKLFYLLTTISAVSAMAIPKAMPLSEPPHSLNARMMITKHNPNLTAMTNGREKPTFRQIFGLERPAKAVAKFPSSNLIASAKGKAPSSNLIASAEVKAPSPP